MASEESDIELPSTLSKKKILKKPPRSPTSESLPQHTDPKKPTTKIMIEKALTALKTRKGVSLYAIKKYMEENFHVNTEKLNFYIKKYIKSGVEAGTIIQTKGVGASGSFKLANVKERTEKKKIVKKTTKPVKEKSGTNEKPAKTKIPKKKKSIEEKIVKRPKKLTIGKEKKDKTEGKVAKQKKNKEVEKEDKVEMPKKKTAKSMAMKNMKAANGARTPAKKKSAMMKRKSIGSIIKPPKMKPKAQA